MTPQQRKAAEAMYAALSMLPCRCSHNVPYAGCPVDQTVQHQCSRCKAMILWEDLQLEMVG